MCIQGRNRIGSPNMNSPMQITHLKIAQVVMTILKIFTKAFCVQHGNRILCTYTHRAPLLGKTNLFINCISNKQFYFQFQFFFSLTHIFSQILSRTHLRWITFKDYLNFLIKCKLFLLKSVHINILSTWNKAASNVCYKLSTILVVNKKVSRLPYSFIPNIFLIRRTKTGPITRFTWVLDLLRMPWS